MHKKNNPSLLSFDVKELYVKKVRPFGNSGMCIVPKKYRGKNVLVIIPEKRIEALLLAPSLKPKTINLPKHICSTCRKPIFIAVPPHHRSKFKESDFCQCKVEV